MKSKSPLRVIPLRWEPHSAKDNGWYGITVTGARVVYVYPSADMRETRSRSYWRVYLYFGAHELGHLCIAGKREPVRYRTGTAAKVAAQPRNGGPPRRCGRACGICS